MIWWQETEVEGWQRSAGAEAGLQEGSNADGAYAAIGTGDETKRRRLKVNRQERAHTELSG